LVIKNITEPFQINVINNKNIELSPSLSKQDVKEIKDAQKKMSNMLKVFHEICVKYNIRYFVIGGSLIGALAYKGWIPWDGDVDLEIHEDDYPKFKKIIQKELPSDMWFQDKETDKHYKGSIIAKIRDLNSCYKEYTDSGGTQWHNGLQIDVNIYKEKDGMIYFPDNPKVTYLTINDVYPLKLVPFEDFNVFVMNNSEKYLVNNYNKKWYEDLPKEKRRPHEGLIDAHNTCNFHYNRYPNLYKKIK